MNTDSTPDPADPRDISHAEIARLFKEDREQYRDIFFEGYEGLPLNATKVVGDPRNNI